MSGHPGGRSRKPSSRDTGSAFDVIRKRRITVQLDGIDRELSVAEALLFKTYQAALAGSRMAIRTILKKITAHEAACAPRHYLLPEILMAWPEPQDVDQSMLILNIASKGPEPDREDGRPFLNLEPWAVASALSRAKGRRLSDKELAELKEQTRDPGTIDWPRGGEE